MKLVSAAPEHSQSVKPSSWASWRRPVLPLRRCESGHGGSGSQYASMWARITSRCQITKVKQTRGSGHVQTMPQPDCEAHKCFCVRWQRSSLDILHDE